MIAEEFPQLKQLYDVLRETVKEQSIKLFLAFENSFQRAFERLKPEHPAVLNLADPITRFEFLPENRPFLSIGPNDEADIFAQHIEHGRSGQTFRVHAGEHIREIFTPIHGHQHIYQCLQAIAIGLLQNLPFNSLCKAIIALFKSFLFTNTDILISDVEITIIFIFFFAKALNIL